MPVGPSILSIRRKILPVWSVKTDGPHKLSSTQLSLADGGYNHGMESPALQVSQLAESIPDEDLADDGREDGPHVTVKYGLHTDDPEKVRNVVEGFGSVRVKLGKTSLFTRRDPGKEYDVVKIDVDSPDLRRLNALIADSLENTETHPEYKPHVTLAYVKPGMGKKYEGDESLVGVELIFTKLIFSDQEGNKTTINLVRGAKALSYLNEMSGAPLAGISRRKKKKDLSPPKIRWDESQHQRAEDGTFGSGGSGDESPDRQTDQQRQQNDIHSAAETRWLSFAAKIPAIALRKARDKVGEKYHMLEARYGRRYAIAIMGAGLAGVPLPIPGSSFLTAAPVVAVAELHRRLAGARKSMDVTGPQQDPNWQSMGGELSPDDIESLGREFIGELMQDWESEEQDVETTRQAEGHKALPKDDNWRTVEGTHVHFDKPAGGKIDIGPPQLEGKKPSQLPPRKPIPPKIRSNKPTGSETAESEHPEPEGFHEEAAPESYKPNESSEQRTATIRSATGSPVKSTNKLGGGANVSMIVELEDGFKGVFKPEEGEDPDLREGIRGRYFAREAAASDIANLLGMDDLLPTTFVREIDGKKGSIQQFVPNATLAMEFRKEDYHKRFGTDENDLLRAAAFDYLTGNTDRHGGNWMVTDKGRLVLIDNGLSFPENYEDGWCNADLMNEAAIDATRRIPDVIKSADWKDIESLLKKGGFKSSEIELSKGRFNQLRSVNTFRELRNLDPKSKYGWH